MSHVPVLSQELWSYICLKMCVNCSVTCIFLIISIVLSIRDFLFGAVKGFDKEWYSTVV